MKAPRARYLAAVFRVLRYLKCIVGLGLFFPSIDGLTPRAYCDSDWGGCTSTGRSITGYYMFLGGSLVSWQAKK